MRRVALLLIRLYQRHLSPRKGYACAWRAATGRHSCSVVSYRAIARAGLLRGLLVTRRQFARCWAANMQLPRRPTAGFPYYQRGDCDIDCGSLLDITDCCDGFDLFRRRRSRR